jgi:hypothetical protein
MERQREDTVFFPFRPAEQGREPAGLRRGKAAPAASGCSTAILDHARTRAGAQLAQEQSTVA